MSALVDTMPDMAKKKPSGAFVDPHKGIQINLRVIEQDTLDAIDELAEEETRSRNLTINVILERYLKQIGKLPRKKKVRKPPPA